MNNSLTNSRLLVNGNQAVAHAAIEAGVQYFSHYPGSPVTGVNPELKRLNRELETKIVFNDALNEHIATLACMGASLSGARSMLVMKHVGMNIAADPLSYAPYAGVKGMVIIAGTDPGANSSTGEQDIHWFVKMFGLPLLEPTSIQGIYDAVLRGYELSEAYALPIVIFLPVGLCNSIAELTPTTSKKAADQPIYFHKNREQLINVGERAVRNHRLTLEKLERLSQQEVSSQTYFSSTANIGIITRGLAFAYVHEVITTFHLEEYIELLNVEMVFPINKDELIAFSQNKEEIIFIEDQDGFLEFMVIQACVNQIQAKIHGKDIFPAYGALNQDEVKSYILQKFDISIPAPFLPDFDVPERLGVCCEGCPHTASFFAINEALKGMDGIIGGDIGCSSLPPFKADWLLCMNAGIGMSQGIAHINSSQYVVSTGGDGSFFHGGSVSLQSAVENKINLLHIVFDNRTIAMTGHQASPSSGESFHIKEYLHAIGVDEVHVISAFQIPVLTGLIKHQVKLPGVKVIWVTGPCARLPDPIRDQKKKAMSVFIDNSLCGTCRVCYEDLACPAILNDPETNLLSVDNEQCMRCGACKTVCPNEAVLHISNDTHETL